LHQVFGVKSFLVFFQHFFSIQYFF
jgi:hypothetical protein